jgi:hypothetical protein
VIEPTLSTQYDHFDPNEQIGCHEKIAQMTREMAMITFENWLSDHNNAYKELKRNGRIDHARYIFVDAFAPTLIDAARGYIARALAQIGIPESVKAEYVKALILDAEIPQADQRTKKAVERWKFITSQHPLFTGNINNV